MKPSLLFISLLFLICIPTIGTSQTTDTTSMEKALTNDTLRDRMLPSLSTTFYNEGVNMETYYSHHLDIQKRRLTRTSASIIIAGTAVTVGCATLFGILGGEGRISALSSVTGSIAVASIVMTPTVVGAIYLIRKSKAIEDYPIASFPVNNNISLSAVQLSSPQLSSNAYGCGIVIHF